VSIETQLVPNVAKEQGKFLYPKAKLFRHAETVSQQSHGFWLDMLRLSSFFLFSALLIQYNFSVLVGI
jgi:hypothetical protein